jgi:hypothetical protein
LYDSSADCDEIYGDANTGSCSLCNCPSTIDADQCYTSQTGAMNEEKVGVLRNTLWSMQDFTMIGWAVLSYFYDDCGFADFNTWTCAAYTSSRIAVILGSFTGFIIWMINCITGLQGVIPYIVAYNLNGF